VPSPDRAYLASLAAAADLGEVIAAEVIKPGTIACWRVTTAQGAFHLKRFARDLAPSLGPALAVAAEVERAAGRAGVALAEPVALGLEVGGELVHVHRWWPGRPLGPGDDVADWLGRTLAALHRLAPPAVAGDDALTSYYGVHAESAWRAWLRDGRALGWPDGTAAVLAATEVITAALAAEPARAGTHRDLLPANILTDGSAYVLVDWDSAGPDVPWFEAVRAAVELGRLAATIGDARPLQPDPRVARAILAAYARHGGASGIGGARALAGVLGTALWRLAFAVRAALGQLPAPPAEQAACASYVPGALAKLAERLRSLDALAAALGV
jgi:phosphotransferase family enzyme